MSSQPINSDQKNLHQLRHSATHLLAAAVLELYPKAKPTIGPPIENGFYYDFDFGDVKVSDSDLGKIEEKMSQLLPSWKGFKRKEIKIQEARRIYKDNPYKLELIAELVSNGEKIAFYQSGNFIDLCRGGHVDNPSKKLKHLKLLSVAGAYWRGDEKRPMLTRIYGTCFPSEKELSHYLWQLEEAKKRDHKILGKKLDLFVISEDIGKGLPLLTPKGTIIAKQILDYEYQLEREAGFQHVTTPHIALSKIYKKTGHWQHYRDYMYQPFGIEGEEYVLKPMNCPHHYIIYASRPRSYRDLPLRLAEAGTCYRYEKSGELSGLVRVRSLTIDDAHILMTEDQIEQEYSICINLVDKMFKAFGLADFYIRLSLPDPSDSIKYIADQNVWQKAQDKLRKIVNKSGISYQEAKGEASFYGPKLDYMVKDSIDRQWQMSTLQIDLFMGAKLGLIYTDRHGRIKHPVILHRGLTGSIERTLGILIEHYSGAFPVWLAPIQVAILPISESQVDYGKKVTKMLTDRGVRVELDQSDETLSKKIRNWELEKVPYIAVLGKREEESDQVAVRKRKEGDKGSVEVDKFIKLLKEEIKEHK